MYHSFFIHASVDGPLGCLGLSYCKQRCNDTGAHVAFQFWFLQGMPSSGVAGSYDGFIPSFLRDLHSGSINLHSHQQWRRKWQPTPAFLPGESHGQRSLVGYSPWGRKESDTTERLHLTVQKGSLFSIPYMAFIVHRFFFFDRHSDWCEVISHCSFDLHVSNNEQCWASFHIFNSHLYVFSGEMS